MPWASKEARREYQRAYRAKRRAEGRAKTSEKDLARQRAYYQANKQRLQAHQAAYREEHKERIAAQQAGYRERAAEKIRLRRMRVKFGLTEDCLHRLLAQQNGRCGVCGDELNWGGYRTVHVDHCHTTGKVRGLLCPGCNVGLGHLRESRAVMLRAIAYIEKHAEVNGVKPPD